MEVPPFGASGICDRRQEHATQARRCASLPERPSVDPIGKCNPELFAEGFQ